MEPPTDDLRHEILNVPLQRFVFTRVAYKDSPSGFVIYVAPRSDAADKLAAPPPNPLVVIAPSAVLTNKGEAPSELGVFAARSLTAGDLLGYYTGKILCRSKSAKRVSAVAEKLPKTKNKLLQYKTYAGEYILLDGDSSYAPFLSLINSPAKANMRRDADRVANVLSSGLKFTIAPRKHRVPAFDLAASLHDNAQSELLWDYGFDMDDEVAALKRRAARFVARANENA